ncbi:MAG TPA: sulfatase-like hydrolase/transferase [Castellaniella sp.]|nr:sulfatase-like hydrolase/transferase [Castellaniella sp.]
MRALFLAGFFVAACWLWSGRRRWLALVCVAAGAWTSLYLKSIRHWLDGMGSDSFSEAQDFAWREAGFFLKTVASALQPLAWNQYLETVGMALAVAALAVLALRRLRRGSARALRGVALLLVLLPLGIMGAGAYSHFKSNSQVFDGVRRNFQYPRAELRVQRLDRRPLRVVVYIGESTTLMNWSLYGYPRPTTPGVQGLARTDPGLLVFRDVVSTQVMTSPSLLQALSFGVSQAESYLPIDEQRRISLVDVLNHMQVPTVLLSNQTATGTYNLAGPIIFKHVDRALYSRDNAVLGNIGSQIEARPDLEFFQQAMQRQQVMDMPAPSVVFLHSYAGHGNYLGNIPPSARPVVDDFLAGASLRDMFGAGLDDPRLMADNAEGYDSAMRYVDTSLTWVLGQVRASAVPTVLLYFSDHGESPYTNVGHDSSRFHHEMMRVPFLMYFNAAARSVAPLGFDEFRQAAREGRTATLAQVPATVLRLLDARLENDANAYAGIGLDEGGALGPVVVRRLGSRIDYVRPAAGAPAESARQPAQEAGGARVRDGTDWATRIWLNRRGKHGQAGRPALCYGDADTWGKALRGSLVADCLSLRLAGDAAAPVSSEPPWIQQAVARLAAGRGLSLWLDGRVLPADLACRRVDALRALPGMRGAAGAGAGAAMPAAAAGWLVQLAAEPGAVLPDSCKALQAQGIAVTLTVPQAVLADPGAVRRWTAETASMGWPRDYSVPAAAPRASREVLAGMSDVRWRVFDYAVRDLPWQSSSAQDPGMVRLSTDGDPNSRSAVRFQ